jgi:uncharacterized protein
MLPVTPFRYEEPMPVAEPLVDREVELGSLSERALAGRNTRLEAPRRYGKTSLLRHMIAELPDDGSVGIYVDLYGVVSAPEVIARLERSLRAASLSRAQARWLAARLERVTRSATVRLGPVSLARGVGAGPPGRAEPGALEDRLSIFGELQVRTDAPVIVVLDEFQAVLGAGTQIDATIRSVIQHHDRVGYVFAGSHVGMMRELFSDRTRPFYAQAPAVELGPLPSGPLAEYVGGRFEATGRNAERVLGLLLEMGGGHPQRSMMLAAHLFARTPTGAEADEATFEEALSGALLEADGELHGRWDGLTVSQRRAIAALASGEAPFSQTAARAHATSKGATGKALSVLAEAGDLIRDPSATTGWRIIDPLMREWLRRRDRL